MQRKHQFGVALSVALALVVVFSVYSGTTEQQRHFMNGAPESALSTYGPSVASDPAYYAQLSHALESNGDGGQVAELGRLPLFIVQQFLRVNEEPSSSIAQVQAADSAAESVSARFSLEFNWGELLVNAAIGCAGGALLGGVIGAAAAGIGALLGAGAGCIVGAAAAAANSEIDQAFYSIHAASTNSLAFQEADVAAADEMRLVNSFGTAISALLPATSYFWYRLADIAAQGQIGNSTYNATTDLLQSTILPQLGTVSTYLLAEANQVIDVYAQFLSANGHQLEFEGGQFDGSVQTSLSSAAMMVGIDTNATLYMPAGTLIGLVNGTGNCGVPTWVAPTSVLGNPDVVNTGCAPPNLGPASYTSAVTQKTAIATVNALGVSGTGYPSTQSLPWAYGGVPFCTSAPCHGYTVDWPMIVGIFDPVTECSGCGAGTGTPDGLFAISHQQLQNVTNVINDVAALEYNAVENGKTYWSYLRSIGFTNPNSIPARFQILPPAVAMPPTLCLNNVSITGTSTYAGTCVNMNLTEFESYYLSWLSSIARFFSSQTYQDSSSPCALNCTPWGNLNVDMVGDVYLPGAASSTGGVEKFGNVSTWNVTDSGLIVFPEIHSVTIPIGQPWEVPQDAPIEVFVEETGELLTLTGNGTNVSAQGRWTVLTTSSGDSVYLDSCVIDGTATTQCTAAPYTVNVTVADLSCGVNSSTCPTPPMVSGGFSIPNPFAALGALLCGVVGFFAGTGSGCTSFESAIVGDIVLLVVIVALLYVAVVELESWGAKKRQPPFSNGG